jgi:lipid A 3-O-deacylase
MPRFFSVFLLSLLGTVNPAWADSFVFEQGRGGGVDFGRLAYKIHLDSQWPMGEAWHIVSYLEPALGYWRGGSRKPPAPTIYEVAVTPVFRLEPTGCSAFNPFIETGLGIHFISGHHVTDERDLASTYQFGSHLGVGVRFGTRSQFEVGYRLQHLSNAGLKQPNQGINFNILHFGYSF